LRHFKATRVAYTSYVTKCVTHGRETINQDIKYLAQNEMMMMMMMMMIARQAGRQADR